MFLAFTTLVNIKLILAGYGGDLSELVSNSNQVVNQTKKALNDYAHQGLRTLCMAKRVSGIKMCF